ncbi:hypothetical protein BRAO375_2090002 [Bradyrhizobium sp. ORS 375]|nr:hypothetical protein BRAO375_2090002 [Bradyrhizobium sp. ORS 375]
MLAPRCWCPAQCVSIVANGGQQARRTRQTAYKREDHRAGKAGRSPAAPVVPAACIFSAGGPQASADAWPSLRPLHKRVNELCKPRARIRRGNAASCHLPLCRRALRCTRTASRSSFRRSAFRIAQYVPGRRLLTLAKIVIKHNYSEQDTIERWETPTRRRQAIRLCCRSNSRAPS